MGLFRTLVKRISQEDNKVFERKAPSLLVDHTSSSHVEAVLPEELAMLQRVFDNTCLANRIAKKSRQAEGLAAAVIRLFQSGISDEQELERLLSKIDFI